VECGERWSIYVRGDGSVEDKWRVVRGRVVHEWRIGVSGGVSSRVSGGQV
jgi:hypothetical protein